MIFIIVSYSCSKESLSTLSKNKILLAGTGGIISTYRVWRLDSAKLNNKLIVLSSQQMQFKKKYYFNKTYTDSDLNRGKWEFLNDNKLQQIIYHIKSNDTVNYDLLLLNTNKLTLKYGINSNNIVYYFTISE
jgi:hypothetical protein